MKKRMVMLFLGIALAFSVVACGAESTEATTTQDEVQKEVEESTTEGQDAQNEAELSEIEQMPEGGGGKEASNNMYRGEITGIDGNTLTVAVMGSGMNRGEMPEGEMPEGEMLQKEFDEGEMPEGEMPAMEMPQKEFDESEMPEGEMPSETMTINVTESTVITVNGEETDISSLQVGDSITFVLGEDAAESITVDMEKNAEFQER